MPMPMKPKAKKRRLKFDEGGRSKLWYAACDGDMKALKNELAAGADPNIGDFDRATPLFVAAVHGRATVVRLLLEHGANPNLVDANDAPPLQWAAYKAATGGETEDHLDVIRLLLANGADPDHKNKWGVSPRTLAQKIGAPGVVKLFKSAKRRPKTADDPSKRAQTPGEASGTRDESHFWCVHERLWNELVPPSGQAKTVQGEVIRIVGKLTREAFTNGNINWSPSSTRMWRFVARTLDDDTFSKAERAKIKEWVRTIIADRTGPNLDANSSPYYLVTEKAVAWVLAHPKAIRHTPDPLVKQ